MKELENVIRNYLQTTKGLSDIREFLGIVENITEEIYDEIITKDLETILPNGTVVDLPSLSWQIDEEGAYGKYTIVDHLIDDEENEYYNRYVLENENGDQIFVQAAVLLAVVNHRPLRGFVYVATNFHGDCFVQY